MARVDIAADRRQQSFPQSPRNITKQGDVACYVLLWQIPLSINMIRHEQILLTTPIAQLNLYQINAM